MSDQVQEPFFKVKCEICMWNSCGGSKECAEFFLITLGKFDYN